VPNLYCRKSLSFQAVGRGVVSSGETVEIKFHSSRRNLRPTVFWLLRIRINKGRSGILSRIDAQLLHAGEESGAIDAYAHGSSVSPADAPFAFG